MAAAAGCSSSGNTGAGGSATTVPGATAPRSSTTTSGSGGSTGSTVPGTQAAKPYTGPLQDPKVLATGLESPWGIAFLPGGDALIAERDSGKILRLHAGDKPKQVMQIDGVEHSSEDGLLGLAVSPDYATDHYVYAYFSTKDDNRVVRFRLGGKPDVILKGINHNSFHNGGRLAFGPDRMLYVTTGDAGNRADAQDISRLNGKILRLRPDGSVPPDNPFPNSPVYSYGHRNVEGLAWDTKGRLWASEFGQDTWDELNLIQPGKDYGWPVVEGKGSTHGGKYTNPEVRWATDEASPSGLAFWHGALYLGALQGQRLWRVPLTASGDAGPPEKLLDGTYGRLRTVIVAPDGSLWVETSNTDGRGTPGPTDDRILRFAPTGTG